MLCHCCEVNPIESAKRPLCKVCYSELHKRGKLYLFPLEGRKEERKSSLRERLASRYGEELIADLDKIITDPSFKLRMIGDKYGFTREYTRQIFKGVHGFAYTNAVKTKSMLKIINDRLQMLDPNRRAKEYRGKALIGAIAEKKVSDICKSIGYIVIPKKEDEIIDFVINGYNVEVKSRVTANLLSKKCFCEYFHFNLSQAQRDKVDFVVCYLHKYDEFYVIPRSALSGGSVYIRDKKTGVGAVIDKYEKYKNAWILLAIDEEGRGYNPERLIGKNFSLQLVT